MDNKITNPCPVCKVGQMIKTANGWICNNFSATKFCGFTIYKEYFGQEISDELANCLISGKETKELEFNHKGKQFIASLYLHNTKIKLRFKADQAAIMNDACPFCGGEVLITEKAYICSNFFKQECHLYVPRKMANLIIDESILHELLKNRITKSYDFFFPEKGKFSGRLVFRNKKVEIDNSICQCPKCGVGAVYEGKKAFNCTNWNSELKCDFTIWKEIKGKTITESIVRELCENGETEQMTGFFSLKGEDLQKKLVLTHDNKKVIAI
ncbi:topoisomerase C-terminal repeat-containing protein [Parabacteroides sp. PF5-9]|uniref:topoisomerase C-terminal repeat-containing protein n=1 Tax=Parabacteroides sp. PF5-9 TaxID=1742404 RepID=UPI002473C768|nr:topoisomerase C-terminal repeat-containing protein [Parabacteroides sp. PF5-9]MDH6358967.1 hypothetical protein [Parabacteroides sp. PF5-9]